ncbi:MAG TPA: TraR/DksA C4-type zinc finger protein [Nitrospiraceae bacterium]|jgi:DnaK suppressor protein
MPQQVSGERPELLRHMLLERRQALQRQIDDLLMQHRDNHSHYRDTSVLDLEDMSVRDSMGAQQIALLEARSRERVLLEQAIRRVDDGTYGFCDDCGEPIPPARLRALPFAKRCVACQKQVELIEHIVNREDREEVVPTKERLA